MTVLPYSQHCVRLCTISYIPWYPCRVSDTVHSTVDPLWNTWSCKENRSDMNCMRLISYWNLFENVFLCWCPTWGDGKVTAWLTPTAASQCHHTEVESLSTGQMGDGALRVCAVIWGDHTGALRLQFNYEQAGVHCWVPTHQHRPWITLHNGRYVLWGTWSWEIERRNQDVIEGWGCTNYISRKLYKVSQYSNDGVLLPCRNATSS